MLKRLILILLVSGLFFILGMPVFGVTWCHDYTLYKVTGKDINKTSPQKLRKYLIDLKYKRFSFTYAAQNPKAQSKLRPGDIIIIGNAHSGVVNQNGLIDHFIQKFGASGTVYTPEILKSMTNFKPDWTLLRMINFMRITPDGRKIYPYKNKSVEVWRKQNN